MPQPSLPPGPRLPGPLQAVLWGLRYPQFTRSGHERFGPTFTVRPGTMGPVVLTSDRELIRNLFTGDPLERRHGNDVLRPLVGDGSIFLLEPAEHLERRRLVLPPFHGDRVEAYGAVMQELVDREVAGWRPGQVVPILPIAQNLTIEVILRAVLGVADADLRRRFRKLIDDLLFYPLGSVRLRLTQRIAERVALPRPMREAAAFAGSLPTPAVMTYFPETKTRTAWNLATRRWWRHRDRLLALLDERIDATRSDATLAERDDILAMLVQARDEAGNALSDDALRNDLIGLIGAGHETTAAAIAWGAVLLAHHPETRERAATAARDGDDAYIGALVKEVLRLRSPLPVGAGRRLTEPLDVGDHKVPAGTVILIDSWALHHDPELYPEPERFRPERFLDGAPPSYGWLPFGGGAHRCIGAGLAELEVAVALRAILAGFELEPAGAGLAPPARRGITIVPYGGGRVRVGDPVGAGANGQPRSATRTRPPRTPT